MSILVGSKLPLNLQLEGGDSNKFPLAFVYDQVGTPVPSSPFQMIHIDKGLYLNRDYSVRLMDQKLFVVYIVYNDPFYLEEDPYYYPRTEEMFDIDLATSDISQGIEEIKNYLVSVFDGGKLEGIVVPEEEILGIVEEDVIEGIVEEEEISFGISEEESLEGIIEEIEINGEVDCDNNN